MPVWLNLLIQIENIPFILYWFAKKKNVRNIGKIKTVHPSFLSASSVVRCFFISCFCLVCLSAASQTVPSAIIKGVVRDSSKKEPLAYVTISIQDAKTKEAIKTVLTKENGAFEISTMKDKNIVLVLAFVGYEEKRRALTTTEAVTDLGVILLAATTGQLKEATVTATRPILKQEADRITFDVQADPENKVTTVLDMLRKVPLVSVDGTDNIKLKGNTNYKILLNGKPSSLLARNPADVFRSMPASNILKIEVITTPPAKYDAEGLAGIINIITKKNIDQGYNGSVNTRYNSVYGPGVNVNGTWKQGKFGLNGYVGYNKQNKQITDYGNSNMIFHPVTSTVTQEGQRLNRGNNTYGSAELSFEIDTLNLLTGSIESYKGDNDRSNRLNLTQLNGDNSLAQKYSSTNAGSSGYNGTDLALNYELGFKRSKEQLLTTSYKYGSSNNKQNTAVDFFDKINYQVPNYRQYNNSGTKEHTIQVDYLHPVKKLNIEAGAKAILRKNFSLFTTDNYIEDVKGYVNVPSQTNDFTYLQNVYSVYNSYQLKLKKSVIKGGLRLEHTTVDADFTSTASKVKQEYNNLVPSFSIQQTLNKTNNITLGFSQRIQRPGIWQLNPFIDRSNPKFINVGNPDLRPVVNRSFELGFSNFKKGSVNASLSYSFANNTVENVTRVGVDTVTTSTYQNVGSNKRLGASLNINYPFTSKLTVNINSQLLRVWLKGTYNNQSYNNKGYQGYIFTYSSYKFEKGYRASINLGADSRYVLLQGKDNYYIFSSVSGSKIFWKEKATVSLAVNNPLRKYIKLDYFTSSQDFRQANYNYQYYRTINVSFNYKFGKLSSSIKKNQRSISNDDVNKGGR